MNAKLTIEEMQKLATRRGGKCLSKKYINAITKLKWQCKEGHIWIASSNKIKNGRWCPKCAIIQRGNRLRGSIEEMYKLATRRDGKCLSKKYINSATKLAWQCADGHIWKAVPNSIVMGSWCPICAFSYVKENICREILKNIFKEPFPKARPEWLLNNSGNKMELDGFSEHLSIAFEYQGQQHFNVIKYFNHSKVDLLKRKADDLLKYKICKINNINLIIIPFHLKVENFYEYIIKQCYKLGINVPKHRKIDIRQIKFSYHLENIRCMRKLAEQLGGKCLSKTYINARTKLKWKCDEGHIFEARPTNVIEGHWCPQCATIQGHTKLRGNIDEVNELASERGGECLSKIYVNARTKIKWKCDEGHIWEATTDNIRRGHWCPVCGYKKSWITKRQKTRKSKLLIK